MILPIGIKKKNNYGFTLLEMMLVAIIISILIAVAIPNFKNTFSTIELDNHIKNIQQLTHYANERAILERCYYRLIFTEQTYWLEKGKDKENFAKIPKIIGKTHQLPKNITSDPDEFQIIFTPGGDITEIELIISHNDRKIYKITTKEPIGYITIINMAD